jgi:hypothetical protein
MSGLKLSRNIPLNPVSDQFHSMINILFYREERKVRVILENESETNEAAIAQDYIQTQNDSKELQKVKDGASTTRSSIAATRRQVQAQSGTCTR